MQELLYNECLYFGISEVNSLILKSKYVNENYSVKTWVLDLFKIKKNNDMVDVENITNNTLIFSRSKLSIFKLFIDLLQNHREVYNYVSFFIKERQKNKIELVINIFIDIANIIKKNHSQLISTAFEYFLEYMLISFVLIFYYELTIGSITTTKKIDIKCLILLFKSLKYNRPFLLKSIKMMFGVELDKMMKLA